MNEIYVNELIRLVSLRAEIVTCGLSGLAHQSQAA